MTNKQTDSTPTANPTQTLTAALAAAGLSLAIGEIWFIGPDGSRISLTALVADMPIRGWQRRVEVGAVPKEPTA